ncbi:MAG TPA: hypothetical protein VMU33_11485 [Burkholderiaceae bacterium]|nr:hypothetical protein [Burkholderiaceae bacterium]
MTQAISWPAVASVPVSAGRGSHSIDLDTQASNYKKQLADWVTCPSASTPAGKAKIKQIADKLDAVAEQIKRADQGSTAGRNLAGRAGEGTPATAPAPRAASSTVGTRIDVYA